MKKKNCAKRQKRSFLKKEFVRDKKHKCSAMKTNKSDISAKKDAVWPDYTEM